MCHWAWLGAAMLAMACGGASAAEDGAQLFLDHCSACHQSHGEGTPNLAPPLNSAVLRASVKAGAADYTARVVLNGLSGRINIDGQTFISAMPAKSELSDAEVAAVVAHVLVDLNGIAADGAGLPDADRIAALRQAPEGHAALGKLRAGFKAFE